MDEIPACCCKYGLTFNAALMQSSHMSRILGDLPILGHFNSEFNTVMETAWKKTGTFWNKKILKIYLSKTLTGRCNYM